MSNTKIKKNIGIFIVIFIVYSLYNLFLTRHGFLNDVIFYVLNLPVFDSCISHISPGGLGGGFPSWCPYVEKTSLSLSIFVPIVLILIIGKCWIFPKQIPNNHA